MALAYSMTLVNETTGSSVGVLAKPFTKPLYQSPYSCGTMNHYDVPSAFRLAYATSSSSESDTIIRLNIADRLVAALPHTQSPEQTGVSESGQITLEQIKQEHQRRITAGAFENAKSLANRWAKPDAELDFEELESGIKEFTMGWEQEIDDIYGED